MDLSNRMNTYVNQKWPLGIYSFNDDIANIPDVVKLTVGEPGFHTPAHIKEAAIKAIQNDDSHYTNPRGLLSLRINASKFFKSHYGLNYDPKSEMLVTTGVSEGLGSVLAAIINPGDEVIIPTPIYPFYIPNVLIHDAKPIFINTDSTNFKLSPKVLAKTLKTHPKVKAVILNDPNNPTGVVYSKAELQQLADVIKQYPIFCLSDEIYSELTYGCKHYSMGTMIPDQVIMFNGASKTFAMTGWRIGLVCGPKKIIDKINKVHTITITAATTCSQYATNEAFKNGADDALPMKRAYRHNSQVLCHGLDKLGFKCPKPEGAFYTFAKLPKKYQNDSVGFAFTLAKKAHVGVVPGSVFGPGGEGYVRVSYAASLSDIKEALKRIRQFMQK
ncbi:aminotransferase class I/II-fold pyridoxal phosphate-dependent enzyme [Acetilactobacillus jinshanensis]|uniref:Aminotransferase n=1 Tax=Acetilactobacillus jinshanensis TaxID=1720083 RepID=A0A4P6ZK54_9LACO|nr:aminotransferase class I/II-fold pyridoxal phosphate-dependent enzyme [Acetilactobacillus jinshanensis]QBP18028.1 aminotransferase class I/II-fold pyridoxal phosphate-dependent enzyme [Acetilactobacillus jinshanensis]URL60891.1 aminotransferase class I/II-fold pyridoxal phosphate-dependent enzyme [uncultured bacterium]